MRLLVLLFLSTLFVCQAQVAYPAPTPEDFEEYFYDGLKVVEVPVDKDVVEIKRQLVDARDMTILSEGTSSSSVSSSSVSARAAARFLLSVAYHVEVECSAQLFSSDDTNVKYGEVKVIHQFKSYDDSGNLTGGSSGGGGGCVELPRGREFNWGHWTDILSDSTELVYDEWIPVTAFVPNYFTDGSLEYAPAEEWFVLLVLLSKRDSPEASLTQAELLERLRDYGLDTSAREANSS